jgi:beta-galactosidase/beta-glucuronidase
MTLRRTLIGGGVIVALLTVPAVHLRGDVGAAGAEPAPPIPGRAPMIAEGSGGRVALPGPWTVTSDTSATSALKGWQAGAFRGARVSVPFVPAAKDITGDAGLRNFRGSVAWYRTTFTVPADGRYAIRFESVHHKAQVWLDGHLRMKHTGEYLPFEVRSRLAAGVRHTLVVRADWRGPTAMKRTGWHRTWFNFGGINREVTIRPLGISEIRTPTVTTRLRGGAAVVDITMHVRNYSHDRDVHVEGAIVRGDQRYPLTFPSAIIPHNLTGVFRTQVTIDQPALWSPEAPNLYSLELSVPGEATYQTNIGLRQLSWLGSKMFLNGQRLFLRGASIHEDARGRGDALTGADMDTIVADLKALGANATRAQHPLNPALLERLDAAGIMVWQGIGPVDAPGAWTSVTPALQAQARERVRENFFQAQTHPSVVAWNLANEVAGNGHPGGQAQFIDQMAQELHKRDPGRMVALDLWGQHAPDVPGPMYHNIDAIGATNYLGWYEDTFATPTQLAALIKQRVQLYEKVFAGKVLIISEFGAEGNSHNPTGVPGGFGFQARLIETHLRTYRLLPGLSGALIWNLRDFAVSPAFAGGSISKIVPGIRIVRGLNTKGLMTYGGVPKPAYKVARDLLPQLR